jgi:hypothetical protein
LINTRRPLLELVAVGMAFAVGGQSGTALEKDPWCLTWLSQKMTSLEGVWRTGVRAAELETLSWRLCCSSVPVEDSCLPWLMAR